MAEGLRRAVNASRATRGQAPLCDYDTGTAGSGPSKCHRTAKWDWDDETAQKRRPVCGIHKRSVEAKFRGNVRPIGTEETDR